MQYSGRLFLLGAGVRTAGLVASKGLPAGNRPEPADFRSATTASTRTRSILTILASLALSALPLAAQAGPRTNVSQGLTLAGAPLAIHGYDPVAYFTDGQAVQGQAQHTVVYEGGAYRFANESHRQAFEKEPARYAPQYGGFCAYGVALGAKFDGDPRVWAIVDGRLFFNLSPDIQKTWDEDRAGNIRKAEQAWPRIRDKQPAELR